ncbi:PEP-CTERM sorting domain-containing protein [Polymorphobacter arshaanensis]|uniref:PEP-CTERM sorting domain-containing protein n=2 Tax=Glacieibacterium arshaanense TaxID=2511025 RepID=A0A4Y9EM25_9SPHN|nr:PEP-CTERM sorting domain-containing protein [Polymorphobacter arshaanensis]
MQLFTQSFALSPVTPLFALFDTSTIDKVVFSAHGGTRHGFGGGPSDHFVIDDLSLNFAAVPEPASWTLMIAGFGMVGASVRRRKAALAA